MRIAFVNFTPIEYTVTTPYEKPLGGSESAMCYLAVWLASLGHSVTLFCRVDKVRVIKGVLHIPIIDISNKILKGLDFLVIQNTPIDAINIKRLLPQKTKLILWTQHASDQPPSKCLADEPYKVVFDGFIFISSWQINDYVNVFGLDRSRCYILRNAVSPGFINIFPQDKDFIKRKKEPPVLAYTSTPFRGLNLLLDVFPEIREEVPGTTLRVYSSMKVYQGKELPEFKDLYKRAKNMRGVLYKGSVSQTKLSKELPEASVMAYPNTFPETSSIAMMEAMAAGLQIVTSNLGALPETSAGFADLVDVGQGWESYKNEFAHKVIECLKNRSGKEAEQKLIRQINFANNRYTWQVRAWEWEMWLQDMAQSR